MHPALEPWPRRLAAQRLRGGGWQQGGSGSVSATSDRDGRRPKPASGHSSSAAASLPQLHSSRPLAFHTLPPQQPKHTCAAGGDIQLALLCTLGCPLCPRLVRVALLRTLVAAVIPGSRAYGWNGCGGGGWGFSSVVVAGAIPGVRRAPCMQPLKLGPPSLQQWLAASARRQRSQASRRTPCCAAGRAYPRNRSACQRPAWCPAVCTCGGAEGGRHGASSET